MSQAPTCALDGCENKTNRDPRPNKTWSKFCSHKCHSDSRRLTRPICASEGCEEHVSRQRNKYCSYECMHKSFKGRPAPPRAQPKKEKVKPNNFSLQSVKTYKPVTDYRAEAYKGMPDLSLDYDVPDTSPNQDYYNLVDRNMNG